jgi:Aspartyl/Asparaginyl beta-hydroxylase
MKIWCQRLLQRPWWQRVFSSSSLPPPLAANVVQGPALIQTQYSRPAPSLLLLPGLRSLPIWTQWPTTTEAGGESPRIPTQVAYQDPVVTQVVQYLESHTATLREEYLAVAPHWDSDYETKNETTTLHHQAASGGRWDWHSYMRKGVVVAADAFPFPETCRIMHELRDGQSIGHLFEGTPFGYAFYSTLHGGTKIEPHTGPTNLRLRIHLPLIVPPEPTVDSGDQPYSLSCGMRVSHLVRPWQVGRALVFDDSYNHQVWNVHDAATTPPRVLFLVDIWHPDVTRQERVDIVDMFRHAQNQGWLDKKNPATLNVR